MRNTSYFLFHISYFIFLIFSCFMSTINQIDVLAPFEIWEIPFGNRTIKFFEPLLLEPEYMPHDPDEPGDVEYLEVVCPKLNIDVYADNRKDLKEFLYSEIGFIWQHIVLANDSLLDAESRAIKRRYLEIAEEIDG